MAAEQQNLSKMISAQLRNKANEFLSSRKHANNLADILQLFETETDNYTPVLLTVEVLFTELLKRGDLVQEIIPLKPVDHSPEAEYKRWLNECYEATLTRTLECICRGKTNSRLQALVTACKLMQAEGKYPLEPTTGYYFPTVRLKNIFTVLLDSETSMSAPIARFQEFSDYKDVQQYGLKVLSALALRKSPSSIFMQNYLELFDKLLASEISLDIKTKKKRDEEKEDKLLCSAENKPKFPYNASICRRYANRCWSCACQWPLCEEPKSHRRALLLLVERLMPLLQKPHLTTDMLCDSLDAGGPISMLALQGVLDLVRLHNIDYPDIYDRLYALFEPEMFATRYKKRLVHLTDIFLSSTHLPEALVAAFTKRLSRLALLASPEDAESLLHLVGNLLSRHPALKRMICCDDSPAISECSHLVRIAKRLSRLALLASPEDAESLLHLVGNLLSRHPALKRMICCDDSPAIMSNDPYIMEESCASRSRALGSSLWEARALRRHWAAGVGAAAARVLAGGHSPASLAPPTDMMFDAELKKRFKTIEVNFIRPQGMSMGSGERLLEYWELMA